LTVNVDANGRRYAVEVTPPPSHGFGGPGRDGAFLVSIDGREREVDVKQTGGVLSLLIGTRSYDVSIAGGAVHVDGVPVEVSIVPSRPAWGRPPSTALGASGGQRSAEGPQQVTAPMPGKIVKLLVKPGDRVEPRQGLVVVEAMKMENELRAKAAGTVAEVRAVEGTTVEAGAILIVLE
jgi:biotin carboxyl carrier protein